MPANRSYDVFLLEHGTEMSLISTSFIQSQPSLTVTHDTQLFLSKTVTKTMDKTCRQIAIAEKMDCIIEKVGNDLLSYGATCLPFYFNNIFSKFHPEFYQCENDKDFNYTSDIFLVKYDLLAKCNEYLPPYVFSDCVVANPTICQ